jgi:phage gp36-like protein
MAYATTSDLYALGLPSAALTGVDPLAITLALEAASSVCDSYLRSHWACPIVSPSYALKLYVCQIAAYRLLCSRGFHPEGVDGVVRTSYEEALAWLKDCARGFANPQDPADDSTPGSDECAPLMVSDEVLWET